MGFGYPGCVEVAGGASRQGDCCQVGTRDNTPRYGQTDRVSRSWSRNSRFLLTASRDWNVVLWDLEHGTRVRTIRFDSPVIGASLHPKNWYGTLVSVPSVH